MVSPYFYPEGGGLERYAYGMARLLTNEGHDVEVVCMTRSSSRVEKFDGILVRRIKPAVIISNTPLGLKFTLEVLKRARDKDLIIAHTPVPFAADVSAFVSKVLNVPLIVVYHTVGLRKGRPLLDAIGSLYGRTLERFTLTAGDLISVSKPVWEFLREHGYSSRIYLEPFFAGLTVSERPVKKERAILFVGQLGKYHSFKNLHLLMRAFSRLLHNHRFVKFNWQLWIVGSGDMLGYYNKLSRKLSIENNVIFWGNINDRDMLFDLYRRASVLVLPSSFESFGLVVLEALSSCTPVLVSRIAGSSFLVVNGKNGFILTGDELEENMVSLLRDLADNPKYLKKMSFLSCKILKSLLNKVLKDNLMRN